MSDAAADPIPDAPPPRKPPRRFWLYLPFVLILLALIAYGALWFGAAQNLQRRLDAQAAALRDMGYVVDLSDRKVSGFPFRMKVTYGTARIAAPAGWSLAAPGFAAEAYLHALNHWVMTAPEGLTFVRAQGGPVAVTGEGLRASVAGTDRTPWRVVLQGSKLNFAPAAGAQPFALASADLIEFYLRPSAQADEGQILFRLEGGKAQPDALLGRLAGQGVVTATLDGRVSKVAAFSGEDWSAAVLNWGRAEGVLNQLQGSAVAGPYSVNTQGGTLGVGADGRLVGALPLQLREAGQAITALAENEALAEGAANSAAAVAAARAQGEAATVNLVFQAGVVTFGPVRIGPSPKVG